jgi:hypothetical protein
LAHQAFSSTVTPADQEAVPEPVKPVLKGERNPIITASALTMYEPNSGFMLILVLRLLVLHRIRILHLSIMTNLLRRDYRLLLLSMRRSRFWMEDMLEQMKLSEVTLG